MAGPDDSSLTARAITRRSGHSSRSAAQDNITSRIRFRIAPGKGIEPPRARPVPRPGAISIRRSRALFRQEGLEILTVRDGRELRVFVFENSASRWGNLCPADEFRWPAGSAFRSGDLPDIMRVNQCGLLNLYCLRACVLQARHGEPMLSTAPQAAQR